MSIKDKIDLYVEKSRDDMADAIVDLIGFPSINGRKQENEACLKHFLNLAREIGFKTMATTDFDVGIVEMGQGNETVGILVHLDVVDIGDRAKWSNDPFKGVIKDGYIWGRGSVDDKGAAIMSLYAMEAVKRQGLPFCRKVWLIVGTGEEGEWTDIQSFKREYDLPDFGFSPDGDFPIFNAEKGYADVELSFFRDAEKGISFLHSGDSTNTIPSKAEIEFDGGRRISIQGIAAHSSTPEMGDNAIIKLCAVLAETGATETEATETKAKGVSEQLSAESLMVTPSTAANMVLLTETSSVEAMSGSETGLDFVRFVNDLLGGEGFGDGLGIDDGEDYYNGEYVGSTTAVPTVLTLNGDGVKLNINVRHRFGTSSEEILSALSACSHAYGFRCSIKEYMDPMFVSSELPFLKIMCQIHDEYGVPCDFRVAAGTSYAKAMDNFVSWGPVFEGDPSCAHVEDERLSIESMLLATKLYGRFISRTAIDEGDQV